MKAVARCHTLCTFSSAERRRVARHGALQLFREHKFARGRRISQSDARSNARCCRVVARYYDSDKEGELVPGTMPAWEQHEQKRYLVAVDDSADSEFAVDWVINNLYQKGDDIHLLHCIPYAPTQRIYSTSGGGIVEVPADDKSFFFKEAETMVVRRFKHHFEKAKVPFQADIIKENLHRGEQSVANRICDMAARLDANAVVMASHRIGKLSEFILGSIAMQCVHNCSAPVIVLHPRQDVSVKRSPTRKLVLAVDNSETSAEVVDWVIESVYREGDVLHLLHVIPTVPFSSPFHTSTDGLVYFTAPVMDTVENDRDELTRTKEYISRHLARKLHDAGIPFEVDIVTEIVQDPRGAVGGAICDVAQEQEAAAVIIAGYGKGMLESMLLGSITNFVTHHCSRPTVIFHPSAQPTVVRPVSQDKEP